MNVDHLLNQSCTISAAGNQDKFGKKSFGSATSVSCRFQKTNRVIATPQADRTPINGIVWLSASVAVTPEDKITFDGKSYRIMSIEPVVDGGGSTRHKELLLQNWSM